MYVSTEALKNYFLNLNLVTPNDISLAETQSYKTGDSLTNVLISQAKITQESAQKANAHILGLQYVDLQNKNINFETISVIPEIICQEYQIIAYNINGKNIEIAMLDIDNLTYLEDIKNKFNYNFLPRLTNSKSIENALSKYKETLKNEFHRSIDKEIKNLKQIINIEELATDIGVTKIVDLIISYALLENSSDIHIEPHNSGVEIRYRNSGKLYNIMSLPYKINAGLISRIKFLSGLDVYTNNQPQEGKFQIEESGIKITFRTILNPVYFGEKAVIHINKENKIGFTLESLGFFGKNLNKIHRIIQKKNGIILVTGPTNSGKTTLLYTMLDMINESHLNIATIEDPIEYQLPYINQTQINPEIGLNFPNGLRSILKQDPDIIMVGEIRDEETANIVFNASLNGRLILSTIHSNSLVNTIERLQQIKIPKFLLTTNLKMIINQRLVRRLNVDKEKYHMTDTELIELSKNIDLDKMLNILKEENIIGQYQTWRDVDFYRPNPNIPETDQYKGQIIISEILEMDEIIKDAILTGTPTKTLENTIKGQNMSLLENGIIMSIKGETSIDEVFRVINQT